MRSKLWFGTLVLAACPFANADQAPPSEQPVQQTVQGNAQKSPLESTVSDRRNNLATRHQRHRRVRRHRRYRRNRHAV